MFSWHQLLVRNYTQSPHTYTYRQIGALGKIPNGGRNWEGFAADPYLTGVAMANAIKGMQDAGVQACAKHYIGNEQERNRETMSSNIDDRTLHELYLWPFADSVKAGVASFMCSYNKVNGTWACENDKLINGILKGELGHQGYMMSMCLTLIL